MTFWHVSTQIVHSVPAEAIYNSEDAQSLKWRQWNLNDLIRIICSSSWPLSHYKVGISSGQAQHTNQAATAHPSSNKSSLTSQSCERPEWSANFFCQVSLLHSV